MPCAREITMQVDDPFARARAGDESARTRLVREHQSVVFKLVTRVLQTGGLGHLAEDASQESFLRAFGALDRFDPNGPAKFSTGLLTIAARVAIDMLKHARVRVGVEPMHRVPDLVALDRADEQDRQRRLASAMVSAVSELPAPYRAAFVLAEYHGLSHDEVARMLGLRSATVRSRLSKARSRIRERLEKLRDDR
jgi:RNA polymerase sigma-70 factor (ECF subfamily)